MFSYLERVHALPVLVQVVHEIHDDDFGKKRISAAEQKEQKRRNFVGETRQILLDICCVKCGTRVYYSTPV